MPVARGSRSATRFTLLARTSSSGSLPLAEHDESLERGEQVGSERLTRRRNLVRVGEDAG